jgi:hypothetical protein
LLVAAIGVAGCASVAPPTNGAAPAQPAVSVIEMAARIVSESSTGSVSEFTLADGRRLSFDMAAERVPHYSVSDLLVVGRDDRGRWVAVLGRQDGLRDDCFVLRERGINLGGAVEIEGVAWPKSLTFSSPEREPGVGVGYPGATRFCVDPSGHIDSIVPGSLPI